MSFLIWQYLKVRNPLLRYIRSPAPSLFFWALEGELEFTTFRTDIITLRRSGHQRTFRSTYISLAVIPKRQSFNHKQEHLTW